MSQKISFQELPNHHLQVTGIDLEDSYILGWNLENNCFQIELDLSIWPASPFYQKPPRDVYTHFAKGTLIFENVEHITGYAPLDPKLASIDPDGKLDWENIYDLRKNGNEICFETDFTEIRLTCSDCYLTLG